MIFQNPTQTGGIIRKLCLTTTSQTTRKRFTICWTKWILPSRRAGLKSKSGRFWSRSARARLERCFTSWIAKKEGPLRWNSWLYQRSQSKLISLRGHMRLRWKESRLNWKIFSWNWIFCRNWTMLICKSCNWIYEISA